MRVAPLALLLLASLLISGAARAESPAVVADVAPVHSLVAQVMDGVGEPRLLLPSGEPLHDAGLSPSSAAALEGADLVVWTGPGLLPWLADLLATIAPEAATLSLLDAPGWTPLPARANHRLDEPGDDTAVGDEAGTPDPHAWLVPAVASAWVGAIAEALAAADPANAGAYRANAAAAQGRLAALRAEVVAHLAPLAGRPYAVGHDAYQYLEAAASLSPAWALETAHGAAPPVSVVGAVGTAIGRGEIGCVLADAETPPSLLEMLGDMGEVRVVEADPDGLRLPPGPDLYEALARGVADAVADCLGGA